MMTRTDAMILMLGWQGGTAHQVCEVLGLSVNEFLYAESEGGLYTDFFYGYFITTNSQQHIKDVVIPLRKGCLQYWLGACQKIQKVCAGKDIKNWSDIL